MQQPDIFAIPVAGHCLIYSPLRGLVALASQSAANALRQKRPDSGALAAFLDEPHRQAPKPPSGDLEPEFLGIIPTRDCNMRCLYCGFGKGVAGTKTMPLSLAVAAVDWWAQYCAAIGRKTLDVHFFGGEPFAALDVVETVVHRVRQQAAAYNLRPVLETATNGTFNQACCSFVGDYFNTVVLSLDGGESIQDKYRPLRSGCGGFATIVRNAKTLAASKASLCIRTCSTKETVGDLVSVTDWFCRTFHPEMLNFETLKETPESVAHGLEPPDPIDFAIACVGAMQVAHRYGVVPVYAAAALDSLQHSFCPVGRDAAIVSPDGRVSSCYLLPEQWQAKGLDMDIGRFHAEEGLQVDRAAVDRVRNYARCNERCECCLARYHCAGGCHAEQPAQERRLISAFCIQTRIITLCGLLLRLGEADLVNQLLADRHGLEEMAQRSSDLIEAWRQPTTV